ncbi:hypothetical protein GHC57_10690 [Roseospira navarrensis]|uniref:Solute-binding protein family 3/N-terminal domain-containing protein n=1 Tax=Roseospira navarrensis TaxID=140058 RepID=A0A7X2D359_9PROT|nr:hypothetical protein [Roseospira navarrensis]
MAVLVVAGGLAVSPARAATDAVDAAGEDDTPARPITLCTTPWSPFVEAIPPLVPPWPKPDALALGFAGPALTDGALAEEDGSGGGDTDGPAADSAAPVAPPPVPPLPAVTAGDETPSPDGDAVGGPAADLEVLAVAPASEAEVLPPPAPWEKRIARIAVANAMTRQRMDASVVQPNDAEAPDEETPARIADATPDVQTGAGDAAAVAEPESAPDDPADDVAAPEPAAGPTTAEDALQALSMPAARALMPQGRAGGPMPRAVMAACREGGLDCRISLVPWVRPGSQLESGPCDAVFPVEDTADSRSYMRASRPIVDSRLAFFTLNTSIDRVADLTEFVVLAKGPSDVARRLEATIGTLDKTALVLGPDLTSLIRRLIGLRPTDRVALYGNYHVVTRAMEEVGESVPALGVVPHRNQQFRVGFSRARVPGPVIEAFNAGLKRIEDTRALREILDEGNIRPVN